MNHDLTDSTGCRAQIQPRRGLDVFSCGNGRWQRLVPIDLLKLDDEGAVVTAIS